MATADANGNLDIWALDEMLAEIRCEDIGAARSFYSTWDVQGRRVLRRFPVCKKDDSFDLSGVALTSKFDNEGLKLLKGLDNLEGLDIFGTSATGSDDLPGLKNLKWLRNSYDGRKFNNVLKEKRPELRSF